MSGYGENVEKRQRSVEKMSRRCRDDINKM